MKNILLFAILIISSQAYSQQVAVKYYDTLYYSYGLVRPVNIRYIERNTIHFDGITKKGKLVKATVFTRDLIYYADYDSTGQKLLNTDFNILNEKDTSKFTFEIVVDTVLVPQHHLSVNPFSIPLLGLGLDYMYRFGEKKQVAIHFPFRVATLFGNTLYFQTGIGINFFPYISKKISLYAGISTQFFFLEGASGIGIPITMGFITNITKLLTINGYAGIGPLIVGRDNVNRYAVPEAHIGLGFKFGELYQTTNKRKVKVAK